MKRFRNSAAIILPALFIALTATGCLKKDEAAAADTGSGGTFTASDLHGLSFNTACQAASSGVAGATHVIYSLTFLSSGNFHHYEWWYTTSNCAGGTVAYNVYAGGTYAVGGITSGSLQAIDFTVTTHLTRPYTAGYATALDAQCSGVWTNGVDTNTYMAICTHATMPNSGLTAVANVGSLSGNTLSMGAYEKTVPGIISGAGLPTSASLTFTY